MRFWLVTSGLNLFFFCQKDITKGATPPVVGFHICFLQPYLYIVDNQFRKHDTIIWLCNGVMQ